VSNFIYPRVAGGFIPTGQSAGGHVVPNTDNCVVTGQGVVGKFQIAMSSPPANANDIRINIELAPGSNVCGKGVSWAIDSSSAGVFTVNFFENDTGAAVDVPWSFTIQQRFAAP
jgi:hypothetical protein